MERFIHTKDFSELSLFQLNSILYDINSHFVEFNCAGFCNISPGFVGGVKTKLLNLRDHNLPEEYCEAFYATLLHFQMIQLLLTFSVILIQFQMPSWDGY